MLKETELKKQIIIPLAALIVLILIIAYKWHIQTIKHDCLSECDCHNITPNIEAQLNLLIGHNYYFIDNNISQPTTKHVNIIKRYDASWNGIVTIYEYPSNYLEYLDNYFKNTSRTKLIFSILPHIPNDLINEAIRKEQLKIMLLFSILGTFGLFFSVLLYRIIKNKLNASK